MKLTVILTFCFCLQVAAHVEAQSVTLSAKSAGLEDVLLNIKQQTGLNLIYNERFLRMARPVTITARNEQVEKVLDAIFAGQPFTYAIEDKTIVLKERAVPDVPQLPASTPVIDVHGRVVDAQGFPLAGATVMIKGNGRQTQTDNRGEFILSGVDEKAILVISYIGYASKEINASARITASLTPAASDLDEVVTVAYGNTTARTTTGSVVVIKGEQIRNLPNRSFEKSLQGLVPGLYITQGSGQPGGGVSNFTLRGIATGANPNNGFTARQPLIVVDGMPVFQDALDNSILATPDFNPLAQLNPSDIESISVLKDASAIALYGSKASNGVLLVTTKKGKEGKTAISLRHVSEFSERLGDNQAMLDQQQYLELLYETYRNTDPVQYSDAAILADLKTKFPTRADGSFYPQADWRNALFRDPALSMVNELTISGGNARQTFYLGVEYTKQNGIARASDFDRKSLRFNYDNRPAAWLKFSLNTTISYSEQHYGSGEVSETSISRMSPLNQIRNENGELIYMYQWGAANASDINTIGSYFANPVAVQTLNLNRNRSYRGMTRLLADARFLKYFSFATQVGVDFMLTETKTRIHPKLSEAYSYSTNTGAVFGKFTQVGNLINTNTLRFERKWNNEHSLSALAGHEAQVRTNNYIGLSMTNIGSNPMTEEIYAATLSSGSGLRTKTTLLSYFGNLGYGFRNRYFLTASVRSDGSSLFGENHRFGSHWSIGGGYDVSSEKFMRAALPWISFLKLRGSFGSAGNSAGIIHTLRYTRLNMISYLNVPALAPEVSIAPNPDIRWEKTFSWNVGLDLRVLKDRLQFTADLYTRNTSDLLGTVPIAAGTGYSTVTKNIGNMRNTGLELAFSATLIRTKELQWTMSANWSRNKNRYSSFANAIESISGSNTVNSNSIMANGPGQEYNSFYLVQWAGVDATTGKPLWVDSLGKPTSNYRAARPIFAGRSQPKAFGSISQRIAWRSLSLNMQFNYQYGSYIYADVSSNPLVNDGLDPYINQGVAALDRWQKPGDIATNPRRLLFGGINGTSDNATEPSTRFLLNGDFIRLSNVSLNYQFAKSLLDRIRISGASLFVQANNLAIWTKYSGRQDPENASAIGRIGSTYPLARTYSIGINLNF